MDALQIRYVTPEERAIVRVKLLILGKVLPHAKMDGCEAWADEKIDE